MSTDPNPVTAAALEQHRRETECAADVHVRWVSGDRPRPVVEIIHTPSGSRVGTLYYAEGAPPQGWCILNDDGRREWWGLQRFHQAIALAEQHYPQGQLPWVKG